MLMWLLIQKTYTRKSPKINLSLVMGSSQIILGMVICIRKMMHNNKNLWWMWCCLLPKPTCLFCCTKSMVEALGHASKSLKCVFKL